MGERFDTELRFGAYWVVVMNTFSLSTTEAEAVGSQTQGHLGLHKSSAMQNTYTLGWRHELNYNIFSQKKLGM